MPFGEIKLIPGVNTEKTQTLNEAGISTSQMIRFKDSLVQKYGGFEKFYPFAIDGVPRELHAWQDLNAEDHLFVGSTTQASIISTGSLVVVTPQTMNTDFKPLVIATALSTTITIHDPNIDTVSTFDTIYFETPVSVGGVVLSGVYPIISVTGTTNFTIQVPTAAGTSNTLLTNATSVAGTTLLNFTAVPSWVATGMLLAALASATAIPANAVVTSLSGTQITVSAAIVAPGINQGGGIVVSSLPRYTVTSGSAVVVVQFDLHGLSAGDTVVFPTATTASDVEIVGAYTVNSVANGSTFSITLDQQAASTLTVNTNFGRVGLLYYITLGPSPIGSGYGIGAYGAGGYGTGLTSSVQTGSPITASDWTSDNWGQLLLACPEGGGVYVFDPNGGFETAGLVPTAPPFNGGIFVSTSQQMLVCWASTATKDIGILQDPMVVRWSDIEDYTQFVPLSTNQAGSFRIPIGSKIMGGMAVSNQNLIWTDLDVWAMNYQGQPFIWGFNKIGAGAGLVSSHAAQQLRGAVYWMGLRNFYVFDGQGVRVLPCPVWDAVFQNLSTATRPDLTTGGNDSFTKILLHMDATTDPFVDTNAGGSAHTWTAAGNAQIDPIFGKFSGASGLFDGAGDYISSPDHADFALGSGDWTIDFWFNCVATSGSEEAIAGQVDSSETAASLSFQMRRTTGNVIQAMVNVGAVSFTCTGSTQFTNLLNTGWHHVAFVRDDDLLRLFIDGAQEDDFDISGSVNDSSNDFAIGRQGERVGDEWTGWIDEFRLSVGVARWTGNFTPPTFEYSIPGPSIPAVASIRAMPNTPFNEVGWEYPSADSEDGENDSYVKFNVTEPGTPWDIGQLARSAWIDQTVLGMPIAASPSGFIYQHETTSDADGQPMTASFETGYFYLSPGQEFVFVDQILPDMKWSFYGEAEIAQVFISINVVDYPGDTPTVYGPYLMTEATQYISTRLRGRQGSFTIESSDTGSFWRLGRVRYRYAQDGRR